MAIHHAAHCQDATRAATRGGGGQPTDTAIDNFPNNAETESPVLDRVARYTIHPTVQPLISTNINSTNLYIFIRFLLINCLSVGGATARGTLTTVTVVATDTFDTAIIDESIARCGGRGCGKVLKTFFFCSRDGSPSLLLSPL